MENSSKKEQSHIEARFDDIGVWLIEINRPEKRNAMTRAMYDAVADSLQCAINDPEVRVILFQGRGEAFCSGQDTNQINVDEDLDTSELSRCLQTVIACPKPIIAAIHGYAVGFGASLLTHCDLVVATEDCQVVYPFTKLGICPAFGTSHTIVQTIGRQRAAKALLLGERLTGRLLHEWGMVSHTAEHRDAAQQLARTLSQKLARRRKESVHATRELMLRSWGSPNELKAVSEAEMFHFNRLLRSHKTSAAAKGRMDEQETDVFDELLRELYEEALVVREQDNDAQRQWCEGLFGTLSEWRAERSKPEWRALCKALQKHELGELLRAGDPLTRRAFEKPRGYPGDAIILDMMYGVEPPPEDGWKALQQVVLESDACQALTTRASIVAARLDELSAAKEQLVALSIAGGHVREVEQSIAFQEGRVSVTSYDLDPESIQRVQEDKPQVITVRSNILREFAQQVKEAKVEYDFAWAMGIYDYLNDQRSRSLTSAVWSALKPGGSYLIANYSPRCASVGYGEAVMAWYLYLRESRDMARIADDIPQHEIASLNVWEGLDNGAMFIMEVQKKG